MGEGRIRRVGLDTTVNYTLQATETYDAGDPADSPSSWGTAQEVEDMDKRLSLPVGSLTQMEHNGVLITFARTPDFFHGAVVKMRPSYDAPNTPALEMWTHDSVTGDWTRRRRIDITNPFAGIVSGLPKIFDLRVALELQNVDQVWITMTDDPTLVSRFLAIHLFGRCEVPITITTICEDEDDLPENNCLPPFDWPDDPDDTPLPPIPPALPPFPDLCDPGAIEQYRASLSQELLTIFNAYLAQIDLDDLCRDEDDNPPSPPNFPPIDLCDPDAVAAYKDILSEQQLAYFEELLANLDLTALCPDKQPSTGGEDDDPCGYNLDSRFERQAPETCEPTTTPAADQVFNFFFFYNERDRDNFLANQAQESAFIQNAVATGAELIVFGTPTSGAVGSRHGTHMNSINFNIQGAGYRQFVGVWSLWGGVERDAGGIYNIGYGGTDDGQTYWPMGVADFFGNEIGPAVDGGFGLYPSGWGFEDDIQLGGLQDLSSIQTPFGRKVGQLAVAPDYYFFERVYDKMSMQVDAFGIGGPQVTFQSVRTEPPSDVLKLETVGAQSLRFNGFLGANELCQAGDGKRYISQQHLFSHFVSIAVVNDEGEFLTSKQGNASVTATVDVTEGVDEPVTGFGNGSVLRFETPDYLGTCPPPCHPGCPKFSP